MKINNFVTEPSVVKNWNKFTPAQQERLNKAFKRAQDAEVNKAEYMASSTAPPVLVNERDKRLWPKMAPDMRRMTLMGIRDHALMAANMAGTLSGDE